MGISMRPAPEEDCPGSSGFLLEEYITIGAALLVNLAILAFSILREAYDFFGLNLGIISSIPVIAFLHRRCDRQWLRVFRHWYVPTFLIAIFLESRRLIHLINPHNLDALFMKIDFFLFLGHYPTLLMERITTPALTEILQISYVSFYFLPFCLCLTIYRTRPCREFHIVAATILIGFYLSYIGYYLTPVVGPRFTLDHLQAAPLKGLILFDAIRGMIEQVEGRMGDCFPSGHAMISLLTVLLARRYARNFYSISCIWCLLILLSTVYLRYHYVVDLFAGWALAVPVYRFGPGVAEALIKDDRPPSAG